MKTNFYNKDGSINYDRASKQLNISKNDLVFWHKKNFSLIDTPTLMSGVLVAYRPTSNNPLFYAPWIMKTCFHSNKDLGYIYRVVTRPAYVPDHETYDYFIMDASGKILFKNFELDKNIDKNGIIHLSSPNHDLDNLVYPAQNRQFAYKHIFCYGRSIDELNDHLKSLTSAKIIKKPKDFKKGFTITDENNLDNTCLFVKQ